MKPERNLEVAANVWAGTLTLADYEAKRMADESGPDKRLSRGTTLGQDHGSTEITEKDLDGMRKELIEWTTSGALR
jgi:hypothetical protein